MVEDHRHCPVCGKVVQGKIFCSPSCEDLFRKQQEGIRKARLLSLFLLLLLILLVLLLRV